jgi:DNA-binding transcriptional ArsR family regulator
MGVAIGENMGVAIGENMGVAKELKQTQSQYSLFRLSENPFKIEPLFRDFRNKQLCSEQEPLFVAPENLRLHLNNLCHLKDRRCLIYGGYGVGKTTLIDLILYLACNFHNRFCVRVILTEDNVERAINEMLLSLCLDIIDEISYRSVGRPIMAIKKWLIERKFGDTLLTSMAKLIGRYTEESLQVAKTAKKKSLQVSPMGVGIGLNVEHEIETRRSIQSYVDVLPMRCVGGYLEDMLCIVKQIGYRDIVIFIDEADHLSKIDAFLRMLTKAREVLFSTGFTFLVAGSPEIAKYIESIGIIFDKTIFVEPATRNEFEEILNCRIRSHNAVLAVGNIFAAQAMEAIYESTKGIRKQFIRLAENSLDIAAAHGDNVVGEAHVMEAIGMGKDQIQISVSDSQMRILKSLARLGPSSPSDQVFQNSVRLKREALRLLLEELYEHGYVNKDKQGRRTLYSVATPYKPYFLNQ